MLHMNAPNIYTYDATGLRYVQVFIEYLRIGEMDKIHEKYSCEVLIETKWTDNSGEIITKYDPHTHWNPHLFLENLISTTKETISYSEVREHGLNVITEIRQINGVFWKSLELHNFPVDIQELSIVVATKRSPDEVKLVVDTQQISFLDCNCSNTFMEQNEWTIYKFVKMSPNPSYEKIRDSRSIAPSKKRNHYSKMVASCYVSRKPVYYLANAFFLIFLVTVTSFTIFSIESHHPDGRLICTIMLLLTSVTFIWITNRALPQVSYLTSLDLYAITSVFFLIMGSVWHCIIGNVSLINSTEKKVIDQWVLVAFAIAFILIHVFLSVWLYWAFKQVRALRRQEEEFLDSLVKL